MHSKNRLWQWPRELARYKAKGNPEIVCTIPHYEDGPRWHWITSAPPGLPSVLHLMGDDLWLRQEAEDYQEATAGAESMPPTPWPVLRAESAVPPRSTGRVGAPGEGWPWRRVAPSSPTPAPPHSPPESPAPVPAAHPLPGAPSGERCASLEDRAARRPAVCCVPLAFRRAFSAQPLRHTSVRVSSTAMPARIPEPGAPSGKHCAPLEHREEYRPGRWVGGGLSPPVGRREVSGHALR